MPGCVLINIGNVPLITIVDVVCDYYQICEACFFALATLSLRNPNHCKLIMEKAIAPMVTHAMDVHTVQLGVQVVQFLKIFELHMRCDDFLQIINISILE